MQTWKDMNPGCEYHAWLDEELATFGFINQNKVDDMKDLNGKCNIMRHEILYRHGGVFIDADAECVNTLDDFFFTDSDRWSCYENEENGKDIETGITLISSGFMAFGKGDGLTRECILELSRTDMLNKFGWQATGNRFFAKVIDKFKDQYPVKIYPSWYFIPKHGTGVEYQGSDKIYSKHYWGGTFGLYGEL